MFGKGLWVSIVISLMHADAFAESSQKTPLIDNLLACRDIEKSDARLGCLDKNLNHFSKALDEGQLAIIEKTEVKKFERDSFGLSMPSINGLMKQLRPSGSTPSQIPKSDTLSDGSQVSYDTSGKITKIDSLTVKSITTNRIKLMEITLENGQVWRQSKPSNVRLPRKKEREDLTAMIRSGALGSYFMTLSHTKRNFRVERIK